MPRDGFSNLSFRQVDAGKPRAVSPWEAAQENVDPAPEIRPTAEETAPPLSGDAARLAQLTCDIKDLLQEETSLLAKRRTKEAQALHGKKARLMSLYKATVSQLKVNDRTLGAEDSPQRVYIRTLTDAMRDALKDHARIVLRLKAVSEGLVKSIGEEVAKRNRPVTNYGRSARVHIPKTVAPTSLALNQLI